MEEPAVYRSGLNNYYQPAGSPQNVNKLMARVKPSPVLGPPHLHVLAGKCFSLINNGYKYEFCPFHNVTQKEQTVRWNAFAGILGVWKEWVIANNTFEAMLFTNGDMCPGEKPRQTKVLLRCGEQNKVMSVVEPSICHYELRFETPLACPIDAFLVYPVLSPEGQKEWEQIEEALYREELTMQGYNKYRRVLFQKENLILQDGTDNEKLSDKKKDTKALVGALSSDAGDHTAQKSFDFHSKEECSKAYSEILAEVQRLRKLVNISRFGSNEMLTDAQTNKSSTSKYNQQVEVERTLKGETGERSKEQKIPKQILETRDNKAFVTLVENLKGDPGMKSNSSDGKQRSAAFRKETAVKTLENKLRDQAGEF